MTSQLTAQTHSLEGLADDVTFAYTYDAAGRMTSTAAKIGATDDYFNTYDYDALGCVVKLTQSGPDIAEKRVDFAYSDNGNSSTATRYADLAGNNMVAATDQAFDQLGRVSSITHRRADDIFADYDYTWDPANRITQLDMTFLNAGDNDSVDYSYDPTSQLTAADYASQADESYSYDDTGNRTMTGYSTGDHNRLSTDGTHTYLYDNEGNRTAKFIDVNSNGVLDSGDTDITEYEWDHRNRLVGVTTYDTFAGPPTADVEYTYDYMNQMITRVVDGAAKRVFVHESGQIVLQFDDPTGGGLTVADLSHRYLRRPDSVDALIADETCDGKRPTIFSGL